MLKLDQAACVTSIHLMVKLGVDFTVACLHLEQHIGITDTEIGLKRLSLETH